MLVHEVPPLYLEVVEYMSPNTLELIPTFFTCSSPSPSPEYHSSRAMDHLMMYDISLDLGHVDNLFDMLKGNMLDVIGPQVPWEATIHPLIIYMHT